MLEKLSDLVVAKKYIQKEQSSKSRGIEFKLTFEEYRKLIHTEKCFYTGVELNRKVQGNSDNLTLDRIDSSIGYVSGNVVACSHSINHLKGIIENPKNDIGFDRVTKMLWKIHEVKPSLLKQKRELV